VTDETKERLATLAAPYNREVRLDDVRFASGMRLMRIVIREGHRITQLDIDSDTARTWAEVMQRWSEEAGGEEHAHGHATDDQPATAPDNDEQ
jgi:hypothetical protein